MASYALFTVRDLAVSFRIVCEERGALWRGTGTGVLMGAAVDATAGALQAACRDDVAAPVRSDGRAILEEMRVQDRLVKTLAHLAALATDDPTASPEVRAAAARLGEVLDLGELARRRRATDRIAAVPSVAKARETIAAELAALRGVGVRTAADVGDAWLAAADRLYTLIHRAPVAAAPASPAGLRPRAARTLTALRRRLAEEVANRPELPADLVAQVFSAVDHLAEVRGQGQRNRAARAVAPEATAVLPVAKAAG